MDNCNCRGLNIVLGVPNRGFGTGGPAAGRELQRVVDAAAHAAAVGLECHAGHGLSFDTVAPVAAIPTIVELNIGHYIVGEAIFIGLDASVREMRAAMDEARSRAGASVRKRR